MSSIYKIIFRNIVTAEGARIRFGGDIYHLFDVNSQSFKGQALFIMWEKYG